MDHPRSRGVYDTWTGSTPDGGGSSPLARGLLPLDRDGPPGGGDHPRSRGVYRPAEILTAYAPGSSPLARGLPTPLLRSRRLRQIIPARAGFTGLGNVSGGRHQDHPRSRGVYGGYGWVTRHEEGSSPLARGLLSEPSAHTKKGRIIPARAGFTCRRSHRRRGTSDHPRSRGVYTTIYEMAGGPYGSSPLARGLPPGLGPYPAGFRIIPARAGFTSPHASLSASRRDHPRSRGVYGG